MRSKLTVSALILIALVAVAGTLHATHYEGSTSVHGTYTGTKSTPPPAGSIGFTADSFHNPASVSWHDGSNWTYDAALQGYKLIGHNNNYESPYTYVLVFHGGAVSGDYQIWRRTTASAWQLVEQGSYTRTHTEPT